MNSYQADSSDNLVESTGAIPRQTGQRFSLPALLGAIAVIVICGRSFYLQVAKGSEFRERAEHNRIQQIVEEAPRGILYDRNGIQLVSNVSSTDLIVDPVLLPPEEDESFLIEHLLLYLSELSPEDAKNAIHESRQRQQPIRLKRDLDHEAVLLIQEHAEELQGVRLASSLVRDYQDGHTFAHIVGYTGLVTQNDINEDSDLLFIDKIGKRGIEKEYDASLRGTHGITYQEINASGRTQTSLGTSTPIPGEDIYLTLDSELQKFIYSLFAERDSKEQDVPVQGSVIVMDPYTGEVLAAVSYPSFDPNVFSLPKLNSSTNYFTDANRPLLNRFADGTYPSGSTIKPFLAAAALEEHIITPETTIFSSGGISVGPWSFPDWKAGGHGSTNVTKAIAESVNTFFYAISGGYEEQQGLGLERAVDYLQKFGWGEVTGVDLPSEASGFLPSEEWKEEIKGEPWYIGDTYHLGIGQGDVLVTPLQLATSTAGLANGAVMYSPHFVAAHYSPQPLPVSAVNVQTVQAGMRQAVTDGSALALSTLPIPLAGKTGTAQLGGIDETHAWFTSFGPYGDPKFSVTVLLERGGEGDRDAVPFAKEVWQWLVENRL